jgi:hypothetical protein
MNFLLLGLFFSACLALKNDWSTTVRMKYSHPTSVCIHDSVLRIYMPLEKLLNCLSSKKNLNSYQRLLLVRIVDSKEDTISIKKPANSLSVDDDNQAGIVDCFTTLLCAGEASVYSVKKSGFVSAIRVREYKSALGGHQRQFFADSYLFFTEILRLGE